MNVSTCYSSSYEDIDGDHEFRGVPNGRINHFECWVRNLGWRKMADDTTEKEREERWLKYSEAHEREITRQCEVTSVMDIGRQTLWEGIEVHTE